MYSFRVDWNSQVKLQHQALLNMVGYALGSTNGRKRVHPKSFLNRNKWKQWVINTANIRVSHMIHKIRLSFWNNTMFILVMFLPCKILCMHKCMTASASTHTYNIQKTQYLDFYIIIASPFWTKDLWSIINTACII